jgi:hypothetical protein
MIRYFDYCQKNPGVRPWRTFSYINTFFDEYPGDYPTIGFKIMYDQIFKQIEVLYSLIKSNYKIIHLVRNNYLDTLISRENMVNNKIVHITKAIETKKVYLEPNSLVKKLKFIDLNIKFFRLLLSTIPNDSIEISYESLCSNKNDTLEEVLNFLKVSPKVSTLTSEKVKISLGSYENKIENYDEVVAVLSKSRFSTFISNPLQLQNN